MVRLQRVTAENKRTSFLIQFGYNQPAAVSECFSGTEHPTQKQLLGRRETT